MLVGYEELIILLRCQRMFGQLELYGAHQVRAQTSCAINIQCNEQEWLWGSVYSCSSKISFATHELYNVSNCHTLGFKSACL